MLDNDGDGLDRWLVEGGHDLPDPTHAEYVKRVAGADSRELGLLWQRAVAAWGVHGASRLWQEALAATDASDT